MQQTLLNAEFAFGEYQNAGNKNMQVIRFMKALTKVLHKCFCCTYACRQLHFLGKHTESIVIPAKRLCRNVILRPKPKNLGFLTH